jgi:hypothetical protein
MSRFLNSIIATYTVFSDPHKISELEKFMDYSSVTPPPTIERIPPPPPINVSEKSEITIVRNVAPKPSQKNIITPKQTDTLFWAFYIAKYGYADYMMVGNKYKNKEIEKKQEMIDTLKQTPAKLLKNEVRKISKVAIQEIMSELMMDKKTSYSAFFAMCTLNHLTVYLVNPEMKLYMKFQGGGEEYVFYKTTDGRDNYSIDLDTVPEKIRNIQDSMIQIDFGEKPLKSATAYKIDELNDMANQMGVFDNTTVSEETKKRWKKAELYDKIALHVAKF